LQALLIYASAIAIMNRREEEEEERKTVLVIKIWQPLTTSIKQ
jgi:hypothetical protein